MATTQNKISVSTLGAISNHVRKLDFFGVKLPQLNVKGEEQVKTSAGGLLSFLIMCVTFVFALLKIQHLINFKKPSIASFYQDLDVGPENAFNLGSDGFMIAFGIETYIDGLRNNPRFLKWIVRNRIVSSEGERKFIYHPVRNCTKSDFDKFYEPHKQVKHKIDSYKQNGGLFCVDLKAANIDLYSSWIYETDYSALDIMAVPCGTNPDGYDEPIRDDCEWNRTTVMDYMGDTVDLVMLYNQGTFKQEKFGEDTIDKASVLHKIMVDPNRSNWIGAFID